MRSGQRLLKRGTAPQRARINRAAHIERIRATVAAHQPIERHLFRRSRSGLNIRAYSRDPPVHRASNDRQPKFKSQRGQASLRRDDRCAAQVSAGAHIAKRPVRAHIEQHAGGTSGNSPIAAQRGHPQRSFKTRFLAVYAQLAKRGGAPGGAQTEPQRGRNHRQRTGKTAAQRACTVKLDPQPPKIAINQRAAIS